MKRFLLSFIVLALAGNTFAQEKKQKDDSLRMVKLQEVEVVATRARKTMPVAYSNLTKSTIQKNNFGLDIPSVLALTPSMIATNETGIGIGATSIRLRGTDATRLNVTINGVSMNNPDSHAMYWYDTPDLLSSIGSIQVQRGAGISTNGTGAFGGAINMTTDALTTEFGGDASLSYGSYNTNKQSVHVSSGLINNHWTIDARLSHIGSDGYVDRGMTDLKSYMLQAGYYDANTMLKFVSFGGKASTYLTYDGVTKEDMELYGRRYHTGGQYETSHGPYILADGTHVNYYDDHTDNYLQLNNQLVLSHTFNKNWKMNATAFYTYGYGFYKQYKGNKKLLEYLNIPGDKYFDAEGEKVRADLIREKKMRNHLAGLNSAFNYSTDNLDVAFGGSFSYYTCPHWGELDWVDGLDKTDYAGRWYDNDVRKYDGNLFARANWQITNGLRLFTDLQYRRVSYEAWGVNDNYLSSSKEMQPIDVDKSFNFFNPHIGLNYDFARNHKVYFSFAIQQKEPTRSDFTDRYRFAMTNTYPKAEKLFDYELGYMFQSANFSAGVNLYYMQYDNQLVPVGHINDGYDALNDNVKDSYRYGVELTAAWTPTQWLTLTGNATFSKNIVKDYTNYVVNYDKYLENGIDGYCDYTVQPMGDTRLAYSPKTIANFGIDFHHKGFEAVFTTKYVSKQYFTNYENPDMMLDGYCVSDLNLGYTMKTKSAKSVRFGLMIYNVFDRTYEGNGYGWSDGYIDDNGKECVSHHAFYFPQAPINALANITVKF